MPKIPGASSEELAVLQKMNPSQYNLVKSLLAKQQSGLAIPGLTPRHRNTDHAMEMLKEGSSGSSSSNPISTANGVELVDSYTNGGSSPGPSASISSEITSRTGSTETTNSVQSSHSSPAQSTENSLASPGSASFGSSSDSGSNPYAQDLRGINLATVYRDSAGSGNSGSSSHGSTSSGGSTGSTVAGSFGGSSMAGSSIFGTGNAGSSFVGGSSSYQGSSFSGDSSGWG